MCEIDVGMVKKNGKEKDDEKEGDKENSKEEVLKKKEKVGPAFLCSPSKGTQF